MEQQKILWIVFSIGFLILTIVVGALIFVSPDPAAVEINNTQITDTTAEDMQFDPYEWVRSDEEHPGIENIEDIEEGDSSFEVMVGEESGAEEKPSIDVTSIKKEEPAVKKKTTELENIKSKVVVKQENVVKPQVKKTPEKRSLNEYWIQAGSYKSEFRAEQARNDLAQKGFSARVVSKTINGINYFRVRIGPYEVKAEAEKFLAWVKSIKGFEDCYISKVLVYR